MLRDPRALDPRRPALEDRFYVPRRMHEITHPTAKSFLYCGGPYHDRAWRRTGAAVVPFDQAIGFGDGSAVVMNTAGITPGVVVNPSGNAARDQFAAEAAKLHFTPWGVTGRDR